MDKIINLRVSKEIYEKLKVISQIKRKSVSEIVRDSINAYLNGFYEDMLNKREKELEYELEFVRKQKEKLRELKLKEEMERKRQMEELEKQKRYIENLDDILKYSKILSQLDEKDEQHYYKVVHKLYSEVNYAFRNYRYQTRKNIGLGQFLDILEKFGFEIPEKVKRSWLSGAIY